MTLFEAILYGIVQGLTEFLPISSTAHLRIVPALLGKPDPGAAFTAVIQCGTLAAVMIYFRHDIWRIATGTLAGIVRGKPLGTFEARLGWMIVVGTIPLVACGLLFKDDIRTTLRSIYVVSGSLIILALLLAFAEWMQRWRVSQGNQPRSLDQLTWRDAISIGLFQAVALVPGSSRSGVTITGGLLCGLSRDTAARYSFLLSLPSIFAAAVHEMHEQWSTLLATSQDRTNLLVATVVSGLVGYAAIAFLLAYLKNRSTWVFIWYRLALGGLLLYLISRGFISPDA